MGKSKTNIKKKKAKIMIACLTAVAFFVLHNCSEESPDDFDNRLYSLYDPSRLKAAGSGDDSPAQEISAIQRVGKDHAIALGFVKELESKGVNKKSLDFNNIRRVVCNHTPVTILAIPIAGTQQEMLAFAYNNSYCLMIATAGGNRYTYHTLDGQPAMTFDIDPGKGEFALADMENNKTLNDFSTLVYTGETSGSTIKRLTLKSNHPENNEPECCKKAPSYDDCLACKGIGSSGPPGFEIITNPTAAISCIGAGSNASCN